jgi:hypothetical protein
VKTILRPSNTYLLKLLALATGLTYVTVIYRFPVFGNHGPIFLFVLSLVVLGPIAAALVVYAGKASWIIAPLLVFIGGVSGIMIDVVLDTKEDRNLFPLEIIVWTVVVIPILTMSSALGWFLKNRTSLKSQLAD